MNTRRLGLKIAALAAVVLIGSLSCYAATFNISADEKGTSATVGVGEGPGGYANLETFTGNFSTGNAFYGQGAGQYGAGGNPCTFTALGGVSESGTNLSLVGSSAIMIIPGVGKLFTQASSGSGCINATTGDFSISQSDAIVYGAGSYANATGTGTETVLGHNVGSPTSGSFNFEKTSLALSITTP